MDTLAVHEFLCSLKDSVFLGKLTLSVHIFRDARIDMIPIWNDIGSLTRAYSGGTSQWPWKSGHQSN
uniref:Uncharacterized protein n=1 Tax=Physcomitrium patens TaxID=3218 RepID=A0A7I4B5W2_PHYPA